MHYLGMNLKQYNTYEELLEKYGKLRLDSILLRDDFVATAYSETLKQRAFIDRLTIIKAVQNNTCVISAVFELPDSFDKRVELELPTPELEGVDLHYKVINEGDEWIHIFTDAKMSDIDLNKCLFKVFDFDSTAVTCENTFRNADYSKITVKGREFHITKPDIINTIKYLNEMKIQGHEFVKQSDVLSAINKSKATDKLQTPFRDAESKILFNNLIVRSNVRYGLTVILNIKN